MYGWLEVGCDIPERISGVAQVIGLIIKADIWGGGMEGKDKKKEKNVTFSFQVFQMELFTFHFKMTFFSFNAGQNKARES